MVLGLAGALVCALAYGIATVLQSVGSRRLALAEGLDPRLLGRLARSGPYVTGLALDGVGFIASVLALRTLPLFLVQSAIASSIGVTAVGSARWLRTPLGRTEIRALWTLGLGLVLLAAAAAPEPARPLAVRGQWMVLACVVPLAALTAAASRWRPRHAGAGLAAAAGLGFGGVGIAARAVTVPDPWWHLAGSPLAWALAAYAVVGTYCYAAALQRASATVVAAVAFVVETVVPAVIGLALLGDRARAGFGIVAAAGFAITVGAAVVLARTAPEP